MHRKCQENILVLFKYFILPKFVLVSVSASKSTPRLPITSGHANLPIKSLIPRCGLVRNAYLFPCVLNRCSNIRFELIVNPHLIHLF